MKLTNDTLAILKNFSAISAGLYVPAGKKIRIKDALGKILAEAAVTENFPSFCVQDASKFVSILTADKDVQVDFKASDIVLSMLGGKSKIYYRGSPQSLVNVPNDRDLNIGDPICEFELKKEQLDYLLKITGLLGATHLAIENNGTKYQIRVYDPKDDSANSQTLDIDAIGSAKNFKIIVGADSLLFLEGGYKVAVAKGIIQFTHEKLPVKYWVAPELGSIYDDI